MWVGVGIPVLHLLLSLVILLNMHVTNLIKSLPCHQATRNAHVPEWHSCPCANLTAITAIPRRDVPRTRTALYVHCAVWTAHGGGRSRRYASVAPPSDVLHLQHNLHLMNSDVIQFPWKRVSYKMYPNFQINRFPTNKSLIGQCNYKNNLLTDKYIKLDFMF